MNAKKNTPTNYIQNTHRRQVSIGMGKFVAILAGAIISGFVSAAYTFVGTSQSTAFTALSNAAKIAALERDTVRKEQLESLTVLLDERSSRDAKTLEEIKADVKEIRVYLQNISN